MEKKYVRTADGIYIYDKQKIVVRDNKVFFIERLIPLNILDLGKVIKQADTIQELCDEFVIENDYCGQISQSRYFDFEVAKQNIDIASNDVIYGALRIAGKGLIYVAKMNKDGELELI